MNTDNTSIAGETIDYGPCAFMDTFHPDTVFSSIDHGGRYAYGNQPAILQWNLMGFAQTLLPLIDDDEQTAVALAQEQVQRFAGRFEHFYDAVMRRKLGLAEEKEGDTALVNSLLTVMANNGADFTLTFRRLSDVTAGDPAAVERVRELFEDRAAFDDWAARWTKRLALDPQTPPSGGPARARPIRFTSRATISWKK